MGQSSSDSSLPATVESIQEDLCRHARTLTELGALTYEEFQNHLFELNNLSRKCVDNEGDQLIFAVKRGSDTTLLWKGTIKIACVRRNYETQNIVSFRLLSLSEFLKVYKTLQNQFAAAEQSRETTCANISEYVTCGTDDASNGTHLTVDKPPTSLTHVTTALLLEEFESATVSKSQERLGECCICLERKPEVLLPCAHSYCLPCIEQWNVNHKTCPICREALDSTDDTWVISEAPDLQEICGSLMELSKSSRPSH